jgi:hypothetical protein
MDNAMSFVAMTSIIELDAANAVGHVGARHRLGERVEQGECHSVFWNSRDPGLMASPC